MMQMLNHVRILCFIPKSWICVRACALHHKKNRYMHGMSVYKRVESNLVSQSVFYQNFPLPSTKKALERVVLNIVYIRMQINC